jgi:hypothetical protein
VVASRGSVFTVRRGHSRYLDDPGLVETRRQEAIAFFHVNQVGRTAVERVVALFFSVAAIAGSVGVAAGTPDVVLPLPPLLFLLLSYMFQQYADLTVLGIARRRLEELVNRRIGGKGLIYETAVAEVRKSPPLKRSVRVLQSLLGVVVVGATAVGAVVAINDHNTSILIGFVAGSALAAGSAGYSYWHMLISGRETRTALAKQGLDDRNAVWLPARLYYEVVKAKHRGEFEQETVERLIRSGIEASA